MQLIIRDLIYRSPHKNDEENILKQTDEVKKVCLRLDNLKYYYFAWGGRLITYY